MLEDGRRISDWLQEVAGRYGEQLRIRVMDPQSPEGFYKSLRYWVRRYPTFIINRRTKYTGWDPEALERLLADLCEQLNLA
jgi:nucleoside-diphosphate-sugar epimerase